MIKQGDKVRVTRKPTEKEMNNAGFGWVYQMIELVGKESEVWIVEKDAAQLHNYFFYPLCVLEKVEE